MPEGPLPSPRHPPSRHPPLSPLPPRDLGALALDTSDVVLSTLADAAKLTPVPYLQEASGAALGIVKIIQGVRSNKDAFQRLASDACALVYIVLCSEGRGNEGMATVSPTYLQHARELAETVRDIYVFAEAQASRNIALRIIQYKSDTGTIQEYRDRLRQSLDVFNLESNIAIQETLALIQGQLAGIAEHKPVGHARPDEVESGKLQEAGDASQRDERKERKKSDKNVKDIPKQPSPRKDVPKKQASQKKKDPTKKVVSKKDTSTKGKSKTDGAKKNTPKKDEVKKSEPKKGMQEEKNAGEGGNKNTQWKDETGTELKKPNEDKKAPDKSSENRDWNWENGKHNEGTQTPTSSLGGSSGKRLEGTDAETPRGPRLDVPNLNYTRPKSANDQDLVRFWESAEHIKRAKQREKDERRRSMPDKLEPPHWEVILPDNMAGSTVEIKIGP
ncbi:hypothetical protein DXG01_005759 [Tephrocybe rancida]|nr:hypothetical protein DXG01_005759 [Tephrocybe rancida]